MLADGIAQLFEKAREAPRGRLLPQDARQGREVADEIQRQLHVCPAGVTGKVSGEIPLPAHGAHYLGIRPFRVTLDATDDRHLTAGNAVGGHRNGEIVPPARKAAGERGARSLPA